MLKDRRGRLWFVLDRRLLLIDGGRVSEWTEADAVGGALMSALAEDASGRVLVANFTGPNANANAGRRESLATRADEASAAIALGDTQGALDALRNLLSKIDGATAPPDWMAPSDRTSMLAAAARSLIDEIEARL